MQKLLQICMKNFDGWSLGHHKYWGWGWSKQWATCDVFAYHSINASKLTSIVTNKQCKNPEWVLFFFWTTTFIDINLNSSSRVNVRSTLNVEMSLWKVAFFCLNFLITKLYCYFSAFFKIHFVCFSKAFKLLLTALSQSSIHQQPAESSDWDFWKITKRLASEFSKYLAGQYSGEGDLCPLTCSSGHWRSCTGSRHSIRR